MEVEFVKSYTRRNHAARVSLVRDADGNEVWSHEEDRDPHATHFDFNRIDLHRFSVEEAVELVTNFVDYWKANIGNLRTLCMGMDWEDCAYVELLLAKDFIHVTVYHRFEQRSTTC